MLLGRERYLAVDIGSYSIKAAVVKKGKEGLRVEFSSFRQLPPGTVQNGLARDSSVIASLVSDIIRESGLKPRKVVLTVPGNTLVIRQIELPAMSEGEIKEAIKWEAEDYLPYPVDEAALDVIILERADEKMRILLTAVRKEVVESFLDPLQKAGLKTAEITVQPLALVSLLAFQGQADDPAAVIDIGAAGTRVIIGDKNSIYLARNIDIGGREFTRLLMERKRLSYQEAEEYKLEHGFREEIAGEGQETTPDLSRYISEGPDRDYPLMGLAYQLSDEISRSLTYNPIEYKEETIQNVYLTGGGARLEGLLEIINREIKQEVIPLNPFSGLATEEKRPEGDSAGTGANNRAGDAGGKDGGEAGGMFEAAVAVGAAVNRITGEFPLNLLGREQKAPAVRWERVLLITAVIIMLVVPGLMQFFAGSRLNVLQSEVSNLREHLALIKPRREEYFSLKEKVEVLEAMSRKIEAARYYWDKVLLDYGYVVPEKARLNFVQIVEGSISLGGYAASNEIIIEIIKRMQLSPFFKVVQIKKLLKDGEVNFRIDAEVIRGSEKNDLQIK